MDSFLRMADELAKDEDEDNGKVFKKLYGPTLAYSLIFPSFKRENLKTTVLLSAFYFSTLIVHFILLSHSILLVLDDFELASLELHYWMILVFTIISLPMLNRQRKNLAYTHRLQATPVGKYSRNIYEDELSQKYEKDRTKELKQFLCLPALIIVLAGSCLLLPYLRKLSAEVSSDEAHYTEKGVNMNLPIAGKYPFETHKGLGHFLAVLGQFFTGCSLVSVLISCELLSFRMSQSIIFEFKILQYALDTLMTRAVDVYVDRNPGKHEPISINNVEYQKCIQEGFKDCIQHHHKIMM